LEKHLTYSLKAYNPYYCWLAPIPIEMQDGIP